MRIGLPHAGLGAILHVPAPPRRSRPWSQGNLTGGASADSRSALWIRACVHLVTPIDVIA